MTLFQFIAPPIIYVAASLALGWYLSPSEPRLEQCGVSGEWHEVRPWSMVTRNSQMLKSKAKLGDWKQGRHPFWYTFTFDDCEVTLSSVELSGMNITLSPSIHD